MRRRWSGLLAGLTLAAAALAATTAPPGGATPSTSEAYCYGGAYFLGHENDRLFHYAHSAAATGEPDWLMRYNGEAGWSGELAIVGRENYFQFYAIPEGTGELRRYIREGAYWKLVDGAHYKVIGEGFDRYVGEGRTFTIDAAGKLYGIDDTGVLRSWVYTQDGWENNLGEVIGTGWGNFERVVAGDEGELFAFDSAGNALRYQYRYDTEEWVVQAEWIDSGWGDFTNVLYAGAGVLYAVDEAGDMYWYRYHDSQWANNGVGRWVGEGWQGLTVAVSPTACTAS
ncbi:tachylectin-related carbohydrate-binding protein [Actinokineospora diospyrosa]|uniref:Tachylectin n=1 Tax=Actinokineospora diospyrosa TaxID=103728 RepID=A0ABT1IJP9_9PSEU|nr:tachylectin-related carbohydrate-binding protein [Actinokineospora diospyrosa]MCP2272751.1 Tachylectin [Actinokineospora diospyrosa]